MEQNYDRIKWSILLYYQPVPYTMYVGFTLHINDAYSIMASEVKKNVVNSYDYMIEIKANATLISINQLHVVDVRDLKATITLNELLELYIDHYNEASSKLKEINPNNHNSLSKNQVINMTSGYLVELRHKLKHGTIK